MLNNVETLRYSICDSLHDGFLLAHDEVLNRRVALKVVKDTAVGTALFQTQLAAKLKHPNFAEIFEFRQNLDTACIAMPVPEGGTLAQLSANAPLDFETALAYFRQILTAIKFAHLHDIIFSNLTPQTIWFLDYQKKRLALADAGLVQSSGNLLLASAQAENGNAVYFAPERGNGQIGKASDVYTAALIFIEMLTGKPEVARLLSLNIAGNLKTLLKRMLADAPQERPRVSEVLEQLDKPAVAPVSTLQLLVNNVEQTPPPPPIPHSTLYYTAYWAGKACKSGWGLSKFILIGFLVMSFIAGVVFVIVILFGGTNCMGGVFSKVTIPRGSSSYITPTYTPKTVAVVSESPDGVYMVSGYTDGSIRLWKNRSSLVCDVPVAKNSIAKILWERDSKSFRVTLERDTRTFTYSVKNCY
jgi:serine/threonine protein kinase